MRKSLKIFILVLIIVTVDSSKSMAQEDIGNEYRITLFPSHKVTETIGGFGYLGYVWNPEKDYQVYYLGWPCATYTPKKWLQIWGGLIGAYTDNENKADQLELRPFAGGKFFLPNNLKWNIYNFTRYEYRALQNRETNDWNNYGRLRVRFGVEIPFASGEKAWQPGSLYGLADIEPYFRFDNLLVDPLRIRGGIGYIMQSAPLRIEFIYHAQFTQPNEDSGLNYTDNIFRINIKLGLHTGILGSLYNPDLDD
ncbi:MAG TPA: hypothetical protein VLQ91_01180 [Draconibacterium sp.]|nr:hypothetical protein [Draconibacterium sp.]